MFVSRGSTFFPPRKAALNVICRCTGSAPEAAAAAATVTTTRADARTLSKEDIDRMRDVSRIIPRKYARGVKLEYTFPQMAYEYNIKYMRKDYAKFGRASGINPGIMWPSKEELADLVYIENKFYPTLKQLWDEDRAKQEAEVEARRQREEEIEQNMAKLADARIAMLERDAAKKAKADEERLQREQLILEVREYIGYNVEPSDPKFKEVMEMKEEEKRKAAKEARKKAKQEKMLAKLMAMGAADTGEKTESGETKPQKEDS